MPDEDFWRQWNSRAAAQLSAYNQGQEAPQPDFGQFSNEYANTQQINALPKFADRQAALMNQHQLEQDAFNNRRNLMAEQRMSQGQMFNQGLSRQRLQMEMLAAAQKNNPQAHVFDELQNLERAYGHNPLQVLDLYDNSPDADQTGMVKMPSRYQVDPVTGREFQIPGQDVTITPEYIAKLRQLKQQYYGSTPITRQMEPPVQSDAFADDLMARSRWEELQAKGAHQSVPMNRAAAYSPRTRIH